MSFYSWKPYVSAAARRKKAEAAVKRAKQKGVNFSPVAASRGAIAKTFWGKAWCDNLERYSDYANRLPRGRTYVRNGSVIDLNITEGEVRAQVMGSSLYQVAVKVSAVPGKQWQAISTDCAGSIDSLVELLQGRLSKAVMERICMPKTGLFPSPKEIQFSCSCPDWAALCKHVAAVLYGVGARLDQQPELIFTLRRVDAKALVTRAGAGLPRSKQRPTASKVLDDASLADVFGIEMASVASPTRRAAPPHKSTADTTAKTLDKVAPSIRRGKVPTARKTEVVGKTSANDKTMKAQGRATSTASATRSATRKVNEGGTRVPKRKAATLVKIPVRRVKEKP